MNRCQIKKPRHTPRGGTKNPRWVTGGRVCPRPPQKGGDAETKTKIKKQKIQGRGKCRRVGLQRYLTGHTDQVTDANTNVSTGGGQDMSRTEKPNQ